MRNVHVVLGWTLTIANGLVGAWALAAPLEGRAPPPVAVAGHRPWAESLILLQAIVGVITLRVNDVEVDAVHQFYGFFSAFAVAIIYSYRQQLESWRYLLYGWGGLFLMGMGLRTILIPGVAS